LKVMKFGGSVLNGSAGVETVVNKIKEENEEKVVVLSALKGVTGEIEEFLKTLDTCTANPRATVDSLRELYLSILTESVLDSTRFNSIKGKINALLERWERVAFGVLYTEELTPRNRDFLLSFGERLSVVLLEGILQDRGVPARALEMDLLGCVTNGEFGRAIVDLEATFEKLPGELKPVIEKGEVPVLTGFFGADEAGRTTIFGAGGTDYSAAVVANILEAEVLELWKDVDGFYSCDPKLVGNASHISHLSYEEAAELAYFGAKILHPLAIWPIKAKGIPVWVGNVQGDGSKGTWVKAKAPGVNGFVKSVAHTKDVGILKIYGGGVGYQKGVLARLVTEISNAGINIKSVITSQTCIALLLENEDLTLAYEVLHEMPHAIVERLELLTDVGLIGIVKEGLNRTEGVAGRIFSAVAGEGINVEMISSGASNAAYYFIVAERDVERAVQAIHASIF